MGSGNESIVVKRKQYHHITHAWRTVRTVTRAGNNVTLTFYECEHSRTVSARKFTKLMDEQALGTYLGAVKISNNPVMWRYDQSSMQGIPSDEIGDFTQGPDSDMIDRVEECPKCTDDNKSMVGGEFKDIKNTLSFDDLMNIDTPEALRYDQTNERKVWCAD